MSESKQSNAGFVVLLAFIVAGLSQCDRDCRRETLRPCGPMRPVTVGGSMVVGCR